MATEDQEPRRKPEIPDWLLLVIGLLLVFIPILVAIGAPPALVAANVYLRICAALGAALIGAFIPGALRVDLPGVKAAGAIGFFALTFLTNPPERAAQAAGTAEQKVIKVCMGNGNDGDDCLRNAYSHYDCKTYKAEFGGGGTKVDEELQKRFCPSKRGKVKNITNHPGGECGWVAFEVTCDRAWWQVFD
jgi:hypothetical protein